MEIKIENLMTPEQIIFGGVAISACILLGKVIYSKSKKYKAKREEFLKELASYKLVKEQMLNVQHGDCSDDDKLNMVTYLLAKIRCYKDNMLEASTYSDVDDYYKSAKELVDAVNNDDMVVIKSYHDNLKARDKARAEAARRQHEIRIKEMELRAEEEANSRNVRLASAALYSLGKGLKKEDNE